VASGLSVFRGRGSIWERFPVEEHGTAAAFARDPERCWELFGRLDRELRAARANAAHRALAELERAGHLAAVVTQNVDGLHQAAGSRTVIEYHGTASRAVCPECGRRFGREELPPWPPAPRCPGCGAVVKPDLVLFDEPIPPAASAAADAAFAVADLVLSVGSSLAVYPAAWLVVEAAARGVPVIVVDPEPSRAARRLARVVLAGPAEAVLPELVRRVAGGA